MKRWWLVGMMMVGVLAQQTREPNKQDIAWACRLDNHAHECRCPAMVAEEQEAWIEHCKAMGPVGYEDCMAHTPSACSIVQKPDTKHPEHTCQRNCTVAVCRCHDGPMCVGPEVR
jgi:hypothetical protein